MSLAAGTRLGPYEILAAIGVGGMGEVYRATDSNLKRSVAIKVLPVSVAGDADRLARFQREAEVLAALNHPNIAAIYGLERTADLTALVMELVEGEDLSVHIARGAIPLAESLPIARQIADALEAAHEQAIIHRDLKPANIKVRADGTVKVLDFGLAKALDPSTSSATADAMNSPTLTNRATQMGMIIGTAAYMAPEQARGRAVDRRADVWAFGVVLYEMLTGRRAFDGDDISITLASVLKEDVKWDALPAGLPASVHRLLRRCLEKDPRKRLRAIGDARIELDEAAAGDATGSGETDGAPAARELARLRRRARWGWLVAGVAVIASAGSVGWTLSHRDVGAPQRLQFALDQDATGGPWISPDGKTLAFMAPSASGGANAIWVRPMDGLDARALPATDGASGLFWSPSSDAIGFTVNDELRRIDLAGGGSQRLCDVTNGTGATWLPSGDVLFTTMIVGGSSGVYRVPREGGQPTEVPVSRDSGSGPFVAPAALPDGKHFLYLRWSLKREERAIYAASVDGGAPVRVVAADSMALYASGHVLSLRGGTLFAQPFDPANLALSGEAMPVADNVMGNSVSGLAYLSVSHDGVLAYRRGAATTRAADLVWIDRTGKDVGTVGDVREYLQIRLSPDGKRAAFNDAPPGSPNYRVSVLELSTGVASVMTDPKSLALDGVWSPDSQSLAYTVWASSTGSRNQIQAQAVGGQRAKVIVEVAGQFVDDWSPDGRYLLLHSNRPSKLFALTLQDPTSSQLLIDTSETIDEPHFSPDGKWIAYGLTEGNVFDVWVASFPAFDQRRRISLHGGGQPFWSADGKEIFYLTPTGQFMSVRVGRTATGALEFSAPSFLFQSPITSPNATLDQYSVAKDGQRFLFIRPRRPAGSKPLVIVVANWPSGLKSQ